MPAPLPFPTTKWNGRLRAEDLDLLRAAYGEGQVNDVIRDVVSAFCARLRRELRGGPERR